MFIATLDVPRHLNSHTNMLKKHENEYTNIYALVTWVVLGFGFESVSSWLIANYGNIHRPQHLAALHHSPGPQQ